MDEHHSDTLPRYKNARYVLLDILREGTQGRVYRANIESTGEEVIVKQCFDPISRHHEYDAYICIQYLHHLFDDLNILHCLHPNLELDRHVRISHHLLMRLKSSSTHLSVDQLIAENQHSFWFAIEPCSRDFWDQVQLTSDGRLSIDIVQQCAYELIRTLSKVHSYGLVHGDIKMENVLINSKGFIRLGDWGSSRHYYSILPRPPSVQNTSSTTSVCTYDNPFFKQFCLSGTMQNTKTYAFIQASWPYISPEAMLKYPEAHSGIVYSVQLFNIGWYPFQNDIWMMGVLIFRLLVGVFPFEEATVQDESFCYFLAVTNQWEAYCQMYWKSVIETLSYSLACQAYKYINERKTRYCATIELDTTSGTDTTTFLGSSATSASSFCTTQAIQHITTSTESNNDEKQRAYAQWLRRYEVENAPLLSNLFACMLQIDPHQRNSMRQLLWNPWFQNKSCHLHSVAPFPKQNTYMTSNGRHMPIRYSFRSHSSPPLQHGVHQLWVHIYKKQFSSQLSRNRNKYTTSKNSEQQQQQQQYQQNKSRRPSYTHTRNATTDGINEHRTDSSDDKFNSSPHCTTWSPLHEMGGHCQSESISQRRPRQKRYQRKHSLHKVQKVRLWNNSYIGVCPLLRQTHWLHKNIHTFRSFSWSYGMYHHYVFWRRSLLEKRRSPGPSLSFP